MKKKLLAVAAVGALTAATAVPAMALENEFHGLFRVRGILDNFNDGAGGSLVPARQPGTRNFIEQRARILYMAKANDDLKLVTHFEIDSRWGDASYANGRNQGGGIGADTVNLETKNVYLDFNIPSTPVNVKLGIQGYTDPYKGIIFNNDAAGVSTKANLGNATVGLTYFRFDDAVSNQTATTANTNSFIANGTGSASTTNFTNSTPGALTRDFLTLGGKYNISKDVKVGVDYFLLYSDVLRASQDRTDIHTFGVNGEGKVGPVTLDGFFLYQAGKVGNTTAGRSQAVKAFAANVGAKAVVGPGTVRFNGLYISGDDNPGVGDRNDFQTIMERGATTSGHTFWPGEMQIMLRNKYNINSDRNLVFDLNNSNQGLIGAFVGYDLSFGKAFVNSNAGFAWVAKDNKAAFPVLPAATPAKEHDSKYLGTEINTEIGYKLYDNLTTSFQAAYMILGDYFKATTAGGKNPENPYTTKVQFNYAF